MWVLAIMVREGGEVAWDSHSPLFLAASNSLALTPHPLFLPVEIIVDKTGRQLFLVSSTKLKQGVGACHYSIVGVYGIFIAKKLFQKSKFSK